MVRTYGLTHIALAVRDADRSLRFYQRLFGVKEVYRQDGFIQAQTQGARDVIVFEEKPSKAGKTGGVAHFGFRLVDPGDVDAAAAEVERAGGAIRSRGEFCPGEPFVFVADPDGYEVEIWYELPTPVDPPPSTASASPSARARGSRAVSNQPRRRRRARAPKRRG